MKKPFSLVIKLAATVSVVALACSSAQASLILVNSGNPYAANPSGGSPYTVTEAVNAQADADMLIVGTAHELGGPGSVTATYDGNAMTLATGQGTQSNIFYLDLTQTTYPGGPADLVITSTYTAGGGLGIGFASIKKDGGLETWESIELHSTAPGGGINDPNVSLVTTADGTFNFVNFNGNKDGTAWVNSQSSPNSPLTPIYANGNYASQASAAGYETNVAAGTHVYSWELSDPTNTILGDRYRRIDAAAFVLAVPEPSSFALLLGLCGLFTALHRRRRR